LENSKLQAQFFLSKQILIPQEAELLSFQLMSRGVGMELQIRRILAAP